MISLVAIVDSWYVSAMFLLKNWIQMQNLCQNNDWCNYIVSNPARLFRDSSIQVTAGYKTSGEGRSRISKQGNRSYKEGTRRFQKVLEAGEESYLGRKINNRLRLIVRCPSRCWPLAYIISHPISGLGSRPMTHVTGPTMASS
jgi:hypothetical protein